MTGIYFPLLFVFVFLFLFFLMYFMTFVWIGIREFWKFWIIQPRLYIGRGMQESQVSQFKYLSPHWNIFASSAILLWWTLVTYFPYHVSRYTMFWVLLLISKLTFSYTFEVRIVIYINAVWCAIYCTIKFCIS